MLKKIQHSEAGVNPALCLSNREIYERICVRSQSLEHLLWEDGPSRQRERRCLPRNDKVGRPVCKASCGASLLR